MLGTDNLLILQGCTEVLSQAREILKKLDDHQYRTQLDSGRKSSIGEHYRHMFDLFYAVEKGLDSGVVDYDHRQRGSSLETQKDQSLFLCERINQFFSALTDAQLCLPVDVKTEVTFYESRSVTLPSTVARELVFVTTHAVHHFAIIRDIAASLMCEIPADIGFAPTTRSYLRSENS